MDISTNTGAIFLPRDSNSFNNKSKLETIEQCLSSWAMINH